MTPPLPTESEAMAFAIMLRAGLPSSEAIRYFSDEPDAGYLAELLHRWTHARLVKQAVVKLLGKAWQDMSTEEMIKQGLDFHYRGLAYVLFSHNYAEASQTEKAKLDTARIALETKVAGMAGKTDALSRFFDDITAGKLKLATPGAQPALQLPSGLVTN